MATINDVAKLANVSKSTVSNVFSKKKYISPALTERVLTAAKELNFQPNYFAKTLATKTSKIIGISLETDEEFHISFQQNIIRGILSVCAKKGYYLLIEPTGMIKTDHVPIDGMIMLNPEYNFIGNDFRPHVWVGIPPKNEKDSVLYVDNDNEKIGYELTMLLTQKHRRIAYINTYEQATVAPERYKGYLRGIKTNSQENLHFYTPKNEKQEEFAYQIAKKLLQSSQKPDAFILDSDLMALKIYQLAKEMGFVIPRDFSVTAIYSSIEAQNIFQPTLTRVNLNEYELGKAAANLLINQLQNHRVGKLESIFINGEIIINDSLKLD